MEQQYDPYKVHTALWEDLNEGWVWVYPTDTEKQGQLQDQRRIIRISKQNGRESVYCEALLADDYYLTRFNEQTRQKIILDEGNLIFISGWYRHILDNMPVGAQKLSISVGRSLLWQLRAALQHPQVGVLLTTVLAIFGIGLAIIGIGLAIIGVKNLLQPGTGRNAVEVVSWAIMILGALVVLWNIVQLCKRARIT